MVKHSLYNPTLEYLALDTCWRNLDFALQDQHPDWDTLECGIVASIYCYYLDLPAETQGEW